MDLACCHSIRFYSPLYGRAMKVDPPFVCLLLSSFVPGFFCEKDGFSRDGYRGLCWLHLAVEGGRAGRGSVPGVHNNWP